MTSLVEMLNTWSAEWWRWLVPASWQSALVALVVLAAVTLGRRWPAPLRYGLLLVGLIKFAVPPMLSLPTGLFSVAGPPIPVLRLEALPNPGPKVPEPVRVGRAGGVGANQSESAGVLLPSSVNSASATVSRNWFSKLHWQTWFLLTHCLGSLAAALWLWRQWRSLRGLRRRAQLIAERPLYRLYVGVAQNLELRRIPALLISSEARTPCAFGIFTRTVLLPASVLERLQQAELKTVLAHELAHFRRGDLVVNGLQLALLAVWWFHPFFWLLHRTIRKVREDCCDDLLLARDLTSENAYCDVLLRTAKELASPAPSAAALAFGENLHPLGRRLRRIMDNGLKRSARLSLTGAVIICAAAGLLLPGLRSQSVPPVPAKSPADPVKELEQARQTAAERSKIYEQEDREMLKRFRGVPVRHEELVISPEIKAKPTAELFEELNFQSSGSKRQRMLLEKFLSRQEQALQFLTVKLSETHSSTSVGATTARRKAANFLASHGSKFRRKASIVSMLATMLNDADAQIAEAAAQGLGALGSYALPAYPPLLDALRNGNKQAALAIARVSPESEAVLNKMLETFKNRKQPVALRTSIIQRSVLLQFKQQSETIESVLLGEFPTVDRRLQRNIGLALLRLNRNSPEAAAAIGKVVHDVASVLTSGDLADLSVPELIEYIREPRAAFEDVEAAQYLQRFTGNPKGRTQVVQALPALIEMLRDPSRPMRGTAAAALANLGAAAKPAVPALLEMFDENIDRFSVVVGLQGIFLPTKDPTPVPTFIRALDDEDENVRSVAARALGHYGALASQAVPKLVSALRSDEPEVQLQASTALLQIDPAQSQKVVPVLIQCVEQPNRPNESANAAQLLGEIGVAAVSAIPSLKRVAGDEQRDEHTRKEAQAALTKIEQGVSL
ncbi:MAG: HEAT repeat domain-containing protein [Acidobacteria bacterium]|nr:HEAT repeat domain-containing protein [Acidobacteriota bacterium]